MREDSAWKQVMTEEMEGKRNNMKRKENNEPSL